MTQNNSDSTHRGLVVVQIGNHLVWKNARELIDSDLVCFYDGDLSKVLTMEEYLKCPDNPPARSADNPFSFRSPSADVLDWVTPLEPWAL